MLQKQENMRVAFLGMLKCFFMSVIWCCFIALSMLWFKAQVRSLDSHCSSNCWLSIVQHYQGQAVAADTRWKKLFLRVRIGRKTNLKLIADWLLKISDTIKQKKITENKTTTKFKASELAKVENLSRWL